MERLDFWHKRDHEEDCQEPASENLAYDYYTLILSVASEVVFYLQVVEHHLFILGYIVMDLEQTSYVILGKF